MRIADGDYRAQVDLQQSALDAAISARDRGVPHGRAARPRARAQPGAVAGEARVRRARRPAPEPPRRRRGRVRVGRIADRRRRGRPCRAARVSLEKTVLRAPFDGVVAEVRTEIGEWITPSPPGLPIPPVMVLLDSGTGYVSAPMDEVDVGRVHAGQAVRITFDAFPGRSFAGKVRRVAPYVHDAQEQNRIFEIEAELDDQDFARSLSPGISADVEVILAVKDGVLRIPSSAVLEGDRVLVARGDRLESRPVALGLKNWQFAEVRKGLRPGDAVVVSLDRAEVKEGARVADRPRNRRGDRAVGSRPGVRGRRPARPRPAVHRPDDPRRRLLLDHGTLGLGQVDAAEHPRVPRPADLRARTASTAARWRGSTTTRSPTCGGTGSGSCSSSTTSCRA